MSAFKFVGMCLFLLLGLQSIQAQDDLIKVGEITNEIRIGQFAGNRNLAFGVKNIVEEILMDTDYSLSPTAEKQINIKLVFFDIKNIGTNVAVFHKDVSITQIIDIGELQVGNKVKKKTTQKGESSEISTSTLVVADDGTFNQQTASIALKKVCVQIVEELLK
jgi:hypothetical protein